MRTPASDGWAPTPPAGAAVEVDAVDAAAVDAAALISRRATTANRAKRLMARPPVAARRPHAVPCDTSRAAARRATVSGSTLGGVTIPGVTVSTPLGMVSAPFAAAAVAPTAACRAATSSIARSTGMRTRRRSASAQP